MFQNWGIKQRVVACLLLFGMLPAMCMYGMFFYLSKHIQTDFEEPLLRQAERIVDTLDRTIFERVGDVQSFAVNTIARDPLNWQGSNKTYLLDAINQYVSLHSLYQVMLIVDTKGVVQAMNTKDTDGKPLKTSLVGQSFASEAWFQKAMSGDFPKTTKGKPLGTYIQNPHISKVINDAYGRKDAYAMTFSAPIKDFQGRIVGVCEFCRHFFSGEYFLCHTRGECER
jgi:hypothetical protein